MLGKLSTAVFLGLVAFLWPHISLLLETQKLSAITPDKLTKVNVFKEHEVKFRELLKNCEDVILVEEEQVALLSCDPGRDNWNTVMGTFRDPSGAGILYQWFYNDADAVPTPIALDHPTNGSYYTTDFHPLGIEYHAPSGTLYITNHAAHGPTLEVLSYKPWSGFGRAVAKHVRTIRDPGIHTPNSLIPLSATSILLTNDHLFKVRFYRALAKAETQLALPGGNVVHVSLPAADAPEDAPANVTTLARGLPFCNGIALLNSSTVAVASTTRRSVSLYALTAPPAGSPAWAPPSLSFRSEHHAPAFLDNLSADSDGRLLVAGHPSVGALSATVAQRITCNELRAKQAAGEALDEAERATETECDEEEKHVKAATWTAELSFNEDGAAVWRPLLVGNDIYGSSATVARDVKKGLTFVSGLYERGLFVGKE
ncbi:uncharacterized protein IWZ02DRAFT_444724 [Phyllosticta citriasiana]|uniref:Calcium-dependent phosphotriesterase n=1 Tax=Phyllosticta citriasiana TaxID=595635 RepID=A0ABR1KK38_9PEZI